MSAEPTYTVRRPTLADALPFADLHAHVWRHTYRGMMADVDSLSADTFAPMWEAVGTAYDEDRAPVDGREFWVALAGEEPAAFLMWGPARDEDAPAPRQVWSLNVHPDHQGTGVAQLLMDRFGAGPAYLWVAKGNVRAIRFYERFGFALDGTESTGEHGGMVEQRMVRLS